jgi:hypothetical protein
MPSLIAGRGLARTEGESMARRIALVLMSLVLVLGGAACAPKPVGPTAGAGYIFSLQVSEATIWLGVLDSIAAARLPQATEVIVRVQDTQGRAVEGVPVTFELEPEWVGSARLAPLQTTTQGGIARAVFSEPKTTGVVRVMARVDNSTAQVRLTVQSYEPPSAKG